MESEPCYSKLAALLSFSTHPSHGSFCWPDFPNGQGPTYFTDYQDWFEITLEIIKDIKEYNWIVKPHPAEKMYGENG